MSDIDNGDVLRLGASWKYETAYEITNVFHCLVTSGGAKDFVDIIDDVQQYIDLMYDEIDVFLSDEMLVDRISVSNVTQDTVFGSINWGVISQGGSATEATAAGVCLLAWGRTFTPRVQIRKYYGVFTETHMSSGAWSGAIQTACYTDLESHITSQAMVDGLTMTGVAWNRALSTYTQAHGVATADEPAYQRRRRRGRGS